MDVNENKRRPDVSIQDGDPNGPKRVCLEKTVQEDFSSSEDESEDYDYNVDSDEDQNNKQWQKPTTASELAQTISKREIRLTGNHLYPPCSRRSCFVFKTDSVYPSKFEDDGRPYGYSANCWTCDAEIQAIAFHIKTPRRSSYSVLLDENDYELRLSHLMFHGKQVEEPDTLLFRLWNKHDTIFWNLLYWDKTVKKAISRILNKKRMKNFELYSKQVATLLQTKNTDQGTSISTAITDNAK
eukprot:GILJ01021334.1.p1 GENE.GILJ01021334.1~~GILJ01021334.1.p1  ORF type:complete len:241 (+),score=22.22 GILJ01021334.1:65-787(+)